VLEGWIFSNTPLLHHSKVAVIRHNDL
jgi:hypothetical protein